MIHKKEILEKANTYNLNLGIIEKDYVLGWLLMAIGQHPATRKTWVFKGGTCIKKCYIEEYRFSEDLDFTLLPNALNTRDAMKEIFEDIADMVDDLSGIRIPKDRIVIEGRHNKAGQDTWKGKIYYEGPLHQVRNLQGISCDITPHEKVIDPPKIREIIHPYQDNPSKKYGILTYSPEELLAEKTRALFERSRPRDLYDLIHLLESSAIQYDQAHAKEIFKKKCETKGIATPSPEDMIRKITTESELIADWSQMLEHQVPNLQQVSVYLAKLESCLRWIE